MAEFAQLLMRMLYSFLRRAASFTLLNYNDDKLVYKEEEDVDEVQVLSVQSREFNAVIKVNAALDSPELPHPTPSPHPQTN
ncbi:hypothetical protein MA16_Dca014982 [Dendrobium catenatum]|uniref:Uncharacterized protein n=1 Tax=Dendrobium catenatum TaxID=906689 RepID=A0A2I0V9J1_9ASPA|nr:hypothetical protein MA16_Dca014982 [Dendrobium catenatum]